MPSTRKSTSRRKSSTTPKTTLPKHEILNSNQVLRAVRALMKYFNEFKEQHDKNSLFELEDNINLQVSLHKIPKSHPKKHVIPIPHPINDPSQCEICFIVKNAKVTKKYLQDQNVPNIKKVIDIEALRTKYKEYEARRKLLGSYDLFICDARILLLLPGLLGKSFIKAKKFPVPIKFGRSISNQVEKILGATTIQLSSGSCVNVKIGKTTFTETQICENILKSIDLIVDKIPDNWNNIKAISILTSNSVSLPIYNNLPESTEESDNNE